jgi:hypothetical protein
VRFPRRAHNPVLRAIDWTNLPDRVSWLGNRRLRFEWRYAAPSRRQPLHATVGYPSAKIGAQPDPGPPARRRLRSATVSV